MTSSIRIALFAGLGAFAMAIPATASPTVSGSPASRPVKPITDQYAACTVDTGGGRMQSCDSLGGGAYKGKKTKGHAQTKKDSSTTNK